MQEKKVVHVCLDFNNAENVVEAVEGLGTNRFLRFTEKLSCGPLKALDTAEGRQQRFAHLLQTTSTDQRPEVRQYLLQYQDRMGLVDLFPAPAPDESALVWFGDMADEQLMLRAVCASWPDTDIYLADVRRLAPHYEAFKNYVPCFPAEVLRELVPLAMPLTKAHRQSLAQEWHTLTTQDHLLRIYEDDRILGVAEDFYDDDLLSACKPYFQNQARIAGEVQQGKHQVGDLHLFYRLKLMADQGRVEIETNPDSTWHSLVRRL
jgi:hypothetical protein